MHLTPTNLPFADKVTRLFVLGLSMPWGHLSTEVLPLLAVFSPLIGLVTAACTACWNRSLVRSVALSNAITTIVLVICMIACYRLPCDGEKFQVRQMQSAIPWLHNGLAAGESSLQGLDVRLSLGVDGLSLWPALLIAIISFASLSCPGNVKEEAFANYCLGIMSCESLLLASLMSGDAISAVVLAEMALVPAYLLVGSLGDGNRRTAAGVLWIWQFAGLSCSLIGVTLLSVSRAWMQSELVKNRPAMIFDLSFLAESIQHLLGRGETALHIWSHIAPWACLLLVVGFAIRLPLFPIHSWFETVLLAAPPGAAALFASSFPILAVNGWLRTGSPFFGDQTAIIATAMETFAIVGLWRAGVAAYRQTDLKQIVVTLSTGLLCLSCASVNSPGRDGMLGAWLLVLSQSLATSIGFLLTGVLERYFQTRDITQFNDLITRCPKLFVVLSVFLAGLAGLPVLSIFAGTYMVFCAASESSASLLIGEIVGMALLVRSTLRVFRIGMLGHRNSNQRFQAISNGTRDLSVMEQVTFVTLLGLLIAINLAPSVLLDPCEPAIRKLVHDVPRVS